MLESSKKFVELTWNDPPVIPKTFCFGRSARNSAKPGVICGKQANETTTERSKEWTERCLTVVKTETDGAG